MGKKSSFELVGKYFLEGTLFLSPPIFIAARFYHLPQKGKRTNNYEIKTGQTSNLH